VSDPQSASHKRGGLIYGLLAYGLWGLVPLYFTALNSVPPFQILAHRIVWSVVFLAVILSVRRRWPDLLRCLCSPKLLAMLTLSSVLIAVNWYVYIYGVTNNKVIQTSKGYYIVPFINVLLGVLVFRERLRLWQWVAVGLAGVGVLFPMLSLGEFPWIALGLAVSFGLYGLVRKIAVVDSLIGLSIETLFLAPVALTALGHWRYEGSLIFANGDPMTGGLLMSAGVVTAVPLLCFGLAARRLRMSTLAFLQYLAPSLQFLQAVLFLHEGFAPVTAVSFAFIWTALAVFSLDSVLALRTQASEKTQRRAGDQVIKEKV
jgi:chloramphenicol-sensitive protein RarD